MVAQARPQDSPLIATAPNGHASRSNATTWLFPACRKVSRPVTRVGICLGWRCSPAPVLHPDAFSSSNSVPEFRRLIAKQIAFDSNGLIEGSLRNGCRDMQCPGTGAISAGSERTGAVVDYPGMSLSAVVQPAVHAMSCQYRPGSLPHLI